MLQANPNHSEMYAQRWRNFVAEGKDIDGEARLIDAMSPRAARILDAGCGTGRVGGYLAARGHTVVGVDLDPVLINYAKTDFPDAEWHVGDLCTGTVPGDNYDIVVSAGNVMGFLPVAGRLPALQGIADSLAPHGRAVIGFSTGRGFFFDEFFALAEQAGLQQSINFSSWECHPFTKGSDFLVAVLAKA